MAKRRAPGTPRLASERAPRRSVLSPQSVTEVRGRFNKAIRMGYNTEEATYFANNGIDPPKRKGSGAVQSEPPQPPGDGAAAQTQTVVGSGDQQPEKFDPSTLAKDWQDEMGWPDLRDLGEKLSGKKPTSKRMAIQQIEDYIAEYNKAAETGDST